MPIPVSVVLDRTGLLGPFDLSPLVAEGSLTWSSVVPGGFASCSFTVQGDFRALLKQIPYLSILRVLADSGRILWEGQIEDLSPTVSEGELGIKVGAFGLQNALKEQTVRTIWSTRDLPWAETNVAVGGTIVSTLTRAPSWQFEVGIDQVEPTDLSLHGVKIAGTGATVTTLTGDSVDLTAPTGITFTRLMCDFVYGGAVVGTANDASSADGTTFTGNAYTASQAINRALVANANWIRLSFYDGGATIIIPGTNWGRWTNIRVLGTTVTEDAAGGFFGDTLIKNLLTLVPTLGQGVIESGSDFTIDHLDASVRRTAYDILNEIAGYYSREWAIWEDALLHWRTPNLSQPQWIIPIAQLSSLDLDASTQNSKKTSYVLYTDAASGLTAEASVAATDRRNPYVLTARAKDEISPAALTMTANTAAQLAAIILNDLGFGPVPAAGSISLPGETIVQHAQGNAVKAWELRAGNNVTIPELPMADVFTQDGRGESLFHIVSAEAETSAGLVTLTLDSYGSKRSDVLLARLAAVTQALGG